MDAGSLKAVPRLLVSFAVIYALLLAGQLVTGVLRLPVPGSVVGMVLLAFLLRRGVVPRRLVDPAAGPLLRHMALFFVPPGVGLILFFDLIRQEWLALALGCVVGTFAVLLTVGFVQQRLEDDA